MPAREIPLTQASVAALRLLVGFALIADEAAAARATLLEHAGGDPDRPCAAAAAVLGAVRARAVVAGVLDGLLAGALGRPGARYAPMSPCELGRAWHEGRDRIAGPELAALLWQVARRAGPGVREIEEEIVAACPLPRLLSAPQRALQLVHGPAPGAPRCATTGHPAPRSAGRTVRR